MKQVQSTIKVKASKELQEEIENELRVNKNDAGNVEDNSKSGEGDGTKV